MFEFYFTIGILIIMTVLLVTEVYKSSVIMFGTLLLFYFSGILTIDETFSGFSNQGMLTIGVLFVIARALQSSAGFRLAIDSLLKKESKFSVYIRLMVPVAFLSAFINNIPIVAAIIPNIKRWAIKHQFPVSKLLIPLSYAAILGGMCTLIGTSTNLIMHGLLLENGFDGFSFFETGKLGLPIALIVIVYISLTGYKFLPENKENILRINESTREFVVEVRIEKDYPYTGKTVEEARLRHLRGLFLFQVVRQGVEIAPINPNETIQLNDRLFFAGLPETIFDMVKTPGFHLMEDAVFDLKNIDSDKFQTYEAVLSSSSPLVGETVRDSKFRNKYDAVILAIHRNGHRINKKIGDIELQTGDTLFIMGKKSFGPMWYNSSDFSLVSESISEYSKPKTKGNLALILMILMILVVATGLIKSMLIAALVTAGIMLFTRIISISDAKRSVDFNILLTIVSALGIARAVSNSGVAETVADFIIGFLQPYGIIGIVAGIFFITNLYTEIITNNATAALLFPVAVSVGAQLGIDPRPLILTVTIAASTSFATPIGYQTNLMVYSPGGYRFKDFLRIGIPINIIALISTTLLVWWYYF